MKSKAKGFTLIELLIVVGILGILAAVTVVVLNPGELLAQARDSTRIADLAAVNRGIALYLSDVATPTWAAVTRCTAGTQFPGGVVLSCTLNSIRTVTDTLAWVNINFSSISTGSPLARLPIDPVNSSSSSVCTSTLPVNGCFYAYKSSATTGQYEINANMESAKYKKDGGGDVESKDGGDVNDWYEVGSKLDL